MRSNPQYRTVHTGPFPFPFCISISIVPGFTTSQVNAHLSSALQFKCYAIFTVYISLPVSPQDISDAVEIESEEFALKVGEKVNVTWNPSSLVEDSLGVDIVRVDITLYRYIDQNEWKESQLVTDLPNTGRTSLTIPELPGLRESNSIDPVLIQVRVNASRTIQPSRSKRSIFGIIQNLAKFAKATVILYKKLSKYQRRACLAWNLLDPGVDTRRLPPCPCNASQASDDDRFEQETGVFAGFLREYVFHRGSGSCYRQRNAR